MTNYEIDILKKTLLKVEQKELKRFKNLPDKKIELSEKFENGIQKLAKKRKTLIWQATKTVPRRIAVVFVSCLIKSKVKSISLLIFMKNLLVYLSMRKKVPMFQTKLIQLHCQHT